MKRREFITLLGGAAAAWPLAGRAQQSDRMRRLGVLMGFAEEDHEAQARIAGFKQALEGLGWTNGRNIEFNYRWTLGDADRMRVYARELVQLAPDVIMERYNSGAGGSAAGNRHRPDRVCKRLRSGRQWPRRQSGSTWRQQYWLQ